MATKKFTLKAGQKPTRKQLEEVRNASKRPITFDEDSPEFTEEQLKKFRRVSETLREERRQSQKQNVTLRLSPQALRKAKSLGKGYTSILARIVEDALNDPERINRAI